LKGARKSLELGRVVDCRAGLLEILEALTEIFQFVNVREHRIHLGLEGEPGREGRIFVANKRIGPSGGAATETTDRKHDFEVVGGVRLLHYVEVEFARDNESFVIRGLSRKFRRDRKLGLFWGEQALLTGLETSEFGAEALEFRVGGGGIVGRIAAKLSEFLTKGEELSLDISVEGIDREATARVGRGFGISHC
jgi:hypothetical protein